MKPPQDTLVDVDGILTAIDPSGQLANYSTDFCGSDYHQRSQKPFSNPLIRACGLTNGQASVEILDATAGLCRDAFLLASAGAHVTAIEASSALFALADDGLRRAAPMLPWLAQRLQIHCDNALSCQDCQHPIIYLDPMFEDSRRSTPKKQTQWLQALSVHDESLEAFFIAVRQQPSKRIIVKRARKAPYYCGAKPSHSIETKQIRFDVLLT